ncbi:hypothetical protein CEXT_688951 [Caerostris extrusa]|uniref:Uncharacterized protein n=1 Tax=Caerostris extrusa TaxID=172846 RepID=A0AAV4P516_CAEEX|nr:hypothetical protein CEXT_688951 [Caerostris extrusa]
MALSSAVMATVGIHLVKTYSFVNFHAFSSKAEGRFAKKKTPIKQKIKICSPANTKTLELTKVNKNDRLTINSKEDSYIISLKFVANKLSPDDQNWAFQYLL